MIFEPSFLTFERVGKSSFYPLKKIQKKMSEIYTLLKSES